MSRHGTGRGLAHVLIEIRQDLIADPAGQRAWAERLAPVLAEVIESHVPVEVGGSRPDRAHGPATA